MKDKKIKELRSYLWLDHDDMLQLYKRTWWERITSRNPWRCWTTMFVWEKGFDEKRVIGTVPEIWRDSIWKEGD